MRWRRGNRLKLVSDTDAPARTRVIFDEVRHALGVPVVPFLYQVYAAYPAFLERHWEAFRPAVESKAFFLLGDRLAAESYTRAHNYFAIRDMSPRPALAEEWASPQPCLSLTQTLAYYQYLDPLLLLTAAAQMQAFEGPIGQKQETTEIAAHPAFPTSPTLLPEGKAPVAIHRIWDERRRLVEIAFVSDEHRALAMWPAFYQEYWGALRELVQSPLYHDCQYRIGESAWGLARELPARIETNVPSLLEADLTEEDISSLVRINETVVHGLSGLVLDIIFAHIGCEGGTRHDGPPREASPPPPKDADSPIRAA
jgi:hypothetical protein